MKKMLALIFTIFMVYPASFVCAQENYKQICIEEAVALFAEKNADMLANKLEIDEAKNNIKAANRLKNPDFNIFYNYGRAGDGNPQQIGLSEEIELFKRSARKNLAKVELKLTEDNYSYEFFNKKMDVKEAYVNLVCAKAMLKAVEDQYSLYEDLLNITKKKLSSDSDVDIDVIQTEIEMNRMVAQVNSARLKVKTARYEFNKALNFDDEFIYDTKENELPLPSDITDGSLKSLYAPDLDGEIMPFEDVIQNALENRFDIKIAKHNQELAHKNLTLVSRQRIPDLTVMGGYAYQPARYSDTGSYLAGAYAGAGLTNIPVLYTYRPEIKNAQIQIEQAQLNYKSVKNKALKDLKGAYETFLTARMNLNLYGNKLVKNSEELIKLSKKSYASGASNLTSLIVMEQSYKSIIMGYMEALADYYNSWIDFLREVNAEKFDIEREVL